MDEQIINIAICDDEENMANLIFQKINSIIKNINKPIKLDKFTSSINLMKSLKKDFYDLIFLDIEMKPHSGIDIAKYINNNLKSTKIVFVTNHNEISHAMYRYSPIAFIRKNHLDEDLEENMDIIFGKLKIFYEYYTVIENKIPKRIQILDICYIKSSGNDIEIHMKNKTVINQRKTFKTILAELNNGVMVQINKGILINATHIHKMNEDNKLGMNNLFLKNGEEFYINKNYYNDVKKKFFEYDN